VTELSDYRRIVSDPLEARLRATIRRLSSEADGLREIIARFVEADGDAKANPMGGLSLGGLMDCRDNSGCVYQSAHLAETLALAQPKAEGEKP
jgi:hypothetical protein